ncbi:MULTISPECIES: GntR family transcriptional regulator [Nocardiopsidaceae]|jgi:GntR family transcriptional regulator|uniref:GntR family transcriptional regulator n=2 Tax=Nocardiopsidaceae TaxID=83676 RepID=A0ABY6YTI4_9ACTN|nr:MULTISPECIES: GntR family transcriptional regulator [Nocardiopsaceae]MEE2043189.1 GntR family transcriptional regulator [Nocardiopsis tropica]MEE2055291.1 GntR family transcriptional regulator [Nocardiopsis umidischolae]WAE75419.1 GntR family transcriptional regulator [Streptomonospora nanhaiensis]
MNVVPTSENGSPPVYREIAEELRGQIRSGRYADGDRLPGENTLMERHGVARATARQALSVLINEGLAVAVRGSGIYVRLFRPVRRHGARRLSKELWGQGRAIWQTDGEERGYEVDGLCVDETVADGHVARALGLTEGGGVLRRSRRYLVEGRPVQRAVSYLPLTVLVDSAAARRVREHDSGPGGIYARLAELGQAPAHFTEEIRVRMPTPEESQELRLAPGTPVLEVARTALTSEHRPVEFNEITMDGSAYVLQYDFDA